MMDMKKYALAYLKYGFALVPLHNIQDGKCTCMKGEKCGKSSGKHPRIKNWQGGWSKDATQIEDWWTKWPDSNIGLVTGKASGGVCVIDVDEEIGRINLDKYVNGTPIPCAKTARTDFDGEHWYFKTEADVPDKIKGIKGLDFRNFGIIVLPPSQGLAKRYEWKVSPKGIEIPTIPDKLLNDLTQVSVSHTSEVQKEGKGSSLQSQSLSSPKDYIKNLYKFISSSLKFKDNSYYLEFNNNNSLELLVTPDFFVSGSRENDLFSLANALIKAGKDRRFVTEVMTRVMFTCHDVDPNFITRKIDNAVARHGEVVTACNSNGESVPVCNSKSEVVTVVTRVREWVGYAEGTFHHNDCYRDLNLMTPSDKVGCRKTLGKMVDEGVLEKTGSKAGTYRKIDKIVEPMNWMDADINDYYPLKMPMDLHSKMAFYPKNIMVVAGAKSTGKTAFLMNMAWMNKDKGVRYLNSEMGNEELKKRISMFGYPFEDWKDIDFIPRSSGFHDLIDPNGFNVIDFLEIGDAFYKIQEDIKNIHDKLERGVCVIGLQKADGAKTGRGGDFSKEKSRIYLALDREGEQYKLTVVDCKNPVHGTMTGKEIPYALNNGTFFIEGEVSNFKKGE